MSIYTQSSSTGIIPNSGSAGTGPAMCKTSSSVTQGAPKHLQSTFVHIDSYLAWAKVRRDHKKQTLRVRRSILRSFAKQYAAVHGTKPFEKANTEQLEQLIDARQVMPSTRADYVNHLAGFYGWAVQYGVRKVTPSPTNPLNPTTDMHRPKKAKPNPKPMPDADAQRAIDAATDRVRAWLLLARESGLRCCEIAPLQVECLCRSHCQCSWVDFSTNQIHIHGKGGHYRRVPLTYDAKDALRQLQRQGQFPFIVQGGPKYGQPLSAAGVSNTANKFLHSMGIRLTIHKLRHAFGTATHEVEKNLVAVQELLGHASLETTRRYVAGPSHEQQQMLVDRASLRSRKLAG